MVLRWLCFFGRRYCSQRTAEAARASPARRPRARRVWRPRGSVVARPRDGVRAYVARAAQQRPARRLRAAVVATRARSSATTSSRCSGSRARRSAQWQAKVLEDSLKGNPDVGERALISFSDGKLVQLEREGKTWRLESELVSRSRAKRPRDAIRLFADAIAAARHQRRARRAHAAPPRRPDQAGRGLRRRHRQAHQRPHRRVRHRSRRAALGRERHPLPHRAAQGRRRVARRRHLHPPRAQGRDREKARSRARSRTTIEPAV